jgi:hypothetical protein
MSVGLLFRLRYAACHQVHDRTSDFLAQIVIQCNNKYASTWSRPGTPQLSNQKALKHVHALTVGVIKRAAGNLNPSLRLQEACMQITSGELTPPTYALQFIDGVDNTDFRSKVSVGALGQTRSVAVWFSVLPCLLAVVSFF